VILINEDPVRNVPVGIHYPLLQGKINFTYRHGYRYTTKGFATFAKPSLGPQFFSLEVFQGGIL